MFHRNRQLVLNQVSGEERQVLQDHLRARRERLAETLQAQSWPSFHLAQWRAYQALNGSN